MGFLDVSSLDTANSLAPRTSSKFSHVKRYFKFIYFIYFFYKFSQVNSLSGYKPAVSQVRIFHQPLRVNAQSKVGSLENASHMPSKVLL